MLISCTSGMMPQKIFEGQNLLLRCHNFRPGPALFLLYCFPGLNFPFLYQKPGFLIGARTQSSYPSEEKISCLFCAFFPWYHFQFEGWDRCTCYNGCSSGKISQLSSDSASKTFFCTFVLLSLLWFSQPLAPMATPLVRFLTEPNPANIVTYGTICYCRPVDGLMVSTRPLHESFLDKA